MKLITHNEKIWGIDEFISKKEAEDLILFSEMRGYEEAKVNLNSGEK